MGGGKRKQDRFVWPRGVKLREFPLNFGFDGSDACLLSRMASSSSCLRRNGAAGV